VGSPWTRLISLKFVFFFFFFFFFFFDLLICFYICGFVGDGCPSDLSVLLLRYSTKKDKKQVERISIQKLPADSVWWRAKCNPTTNDTMEGIFYFVFLLLLLLLIEIHFTKINKIKTNFTITHDDGNKVATPRRRHRRE
jgi:hypothetical protein